MEKLTVVGHGPVSSHSPYVPDFLVVQTDGALRVLTREGLHPGPPPSPESAIVGKCPPTVVPDGSWPFVHLVLGNVRRVSSDAERLEWFPLAAEAQSRAEKAKAIFAETRNMAGRPEDVIFGLGAASALMSVDLEKTARELAGIAAPGESLAGAYERSRKA